MCEWEPQVDSAQGGVWEPQVDSAQGGVWEPQVDSAQGGAWEPQMDSAQDVCVGAPQVDRAQCVWEPQGD